MRSPDPHTPAQPYADRAAKWSDVNTRASIPKLSDLSFKPSNTTARTSIALKNHINGYRSEEEARCMRREWFPRYVSTVLKFTELIKHSKLESAHVKILYPY